MTYPKKKDYIREWLIGDSIYYLMFKERLPHDDLGGVDAPIILVKSGLRAKKRFYVTTHEITHCFFIEGDFEALLKDFFERKGIDVGGNRRFCKLAHDLEEEIVLMLEKQIGDFVYMNFLS